ncbi:GNAT family N-acetyltransferase [Streptomyces sp. NPDC048172]|uniref:bifunctional acetate--CoA ligase family protein/GNAT family N-acetyltransferase n=1 Tax=Streptomyces sp. NPDC048172 TaxID=3365505 RepID=UPI003714D14F
MPGVHALLADGSTALIRRAGPEDSAEVLRLYEEMSPRNLRLRFFSLSDRSARLAAEGLPDPRDATSAGHLALVAETGGRLVGIAESVVAPEGSDTAEVSLAVGDEWHHRGIGTLLLEHLVDAARTAGVGSLTAYALSENHEVLKVFADLGLHVERRFEGPEVRCVVRLEQDERYLDAVDARDRSADLLSLRPLLEPRSIAVVGAGRKPGSVGGVVLRNLALSGFTGPLHAVNPQARAVAGVPSAPSVAELPFVPDLAVLAVPADDVPRTAELCGERGVRALAVLSSGLDRERGAALLAACRRHGMRLVGPNCLGVATTGEHRMNATFAARPPASGTTGVAVQSGGVGIALLDRLDRLGMGVSDFVSLGDKFDVSGNDMLRWWESDGRTELALLHLESFGNPRAFARTARRVARRMPVLTVDAGRSDAGRRAAASHTAAAATPTMTRGALFTQAGIIAAHSIGELVDTAALLHAQPLPTGRSVAVVSNAGGIGVLTADACAEAGLRVPRLPPGTVEALTELLPSGASAHNPVDTTAAVSEDRLRACVALLSATSGVDAVVVALVPTALAAATGDDLLRALTHAPDRRSRTVAAVLPGQQAPVQLHHHGDEPRIPGYADARQAAHALAHAATYAEWRARPPGTVAEAPGADTAGARLIVEEWLSSHPEGGWLDPHTCARLLCRYALPQQPWQWAATEDEAVEAARTVALPPPRGTGRVALKAHWPGLLHKSEQGAVALDLTTEADIRAAYRDFATRFEGQLTGVVVQPMAPRGIELFAGVVQDEVFGPLVVFGLGGTATEVLADHAARLAPLTDRDLHELITSPRCAPLLFGRGGGGPVHLDGLERLLTGLSRMATDLPELAEADLNPVLARPDAVTALDARVRLVPREHRDPYLRRLR